VLVGPFPPSLAGSELVKLRGELDLGLPATEIGPVADALTFVRKAVRSGNVSAAHDISDGGLACALAEMAIAGGIGIEADLDPLVELRGASGETCLFGQSPGGIVLALPKEAAERLLASARETEVSAIWIGEAQGERLEISAAELDVSMPLADAEAVWRSLGKQLEGA
jgi:phosphoribosylformylglycinamidine synthase